MSAGMDDVRLPERFWAKVCPEPNMGCWLWSGRIAGGGYGYVWSAGRKVIAHRLAYETIVESVPDGLELDHLCRVRCCVNPAHLEPVTHAENVRRGVVSDINRARSRAQTHCKNGHEYSEENTYRYTHRGGGPWRGCRTCHRLWSNEWKRQRRETAARA